MTEDMLTLSRIAAEVFARQGVDFATARRAGGWTNITWLAGGLALRLSTRVGGEKIRREARLAALLPAEVGYPALVETGVTQGHEWSLAREVPGLPLGEAWPALTWAERAAALDQLWRKARAVHRVDPCAAAGLAADTAWYNASDPVLAAGTLAHLAADGLFTHAETAALGGILDAFWPARRAAPWLLNHGDLTLDNALYHAGRVVSLMDFEWCLLAPGECDLNELVKWAYAPLDDPRAGEDRSPALRVVAEAARPLLAVRGGWERLRGYAVLLELWLLKLWREHPEGEGPLETWSPYRALRSLAGGGDGYLGALRARLEA